MKGSNCSKTVRETSDLDKSGEGQYLLLNDALRSCIVFQLHREKRCIYKCIIVIA